MKSLDSVADKLNITLQGMGFNPEKVFYENSAFLLGWKIENKKFSIIYRLEKSSLLICSLESTEKREALETVMIPVLRLWGVINNKITAINSLKAMIRRSGDMKSCCTRQKMVEFLQSRGAHVFYDGNDQWIEMQR